MDVCSQREDTSKIGGERIIMLEASYAMWQDHKWMGIGMDRWEDITTLRSITPRQDMRQI